MSLATNIKEFADVLHNIYAQHLSSIEGTDLVSDGVMSLAIPKIVILQQACIYFIKTFFHQIVAFVSFQWLRDFSYFPLLSNETGSPENVIADTFLSSPGSHLFSFSKNGVALTAPTSEGPFLIFNGFLRSDCLVTGLVNSFFFSLPLSLPHFITLRRMFSQGATAAAASIVGTVAAHSLVLFGVIYGIRFLVIPYYSLQPLTFLIGIVIMAIVITEFVKEKRMYLVPLNHYPSLVRIGMINFVVGLCESATVFHDLHHLTLNPEVSYFELYQSNTALNAFFNHTAYLLTFVLGHTIFSFLFCYLILKGNEKVCSLTGWTLPKTASRINKGLLIAILALTFSTFPYYGLDYLFTKSIGFLPEDPAYSNTIFSPTQVRSRNRHFKSRAPAVKNAKTPLELDLNYFDRGMYLNAPKEEKMSPGLQNTDVYNTFSAFNNNIDVIQSPSVAQSEADHHAFGASRTHEDLSRKADLFATQGDDRGSTHGQASSQKVKAINSENTPIFDNTDRENWSNTVSSTPDKNTVEESSLFTKSPSSYESEIRMSTQNQALQESPATYDPALTFEELNYQGESAWLMRHERARRLPEEQDSKKSSIFQKPKSHFKELRLKQDDKQAQAALFEKTQIGSIAELKEGNKFDETFLNNPNGLNAPHIQGNDPRSQSVSEPTFNESLDFTESSVKKEVYQRALVKELFFDREIAANYEKSFTSPFGEESDGTPPELLPVENIIKKRYRLNPVYRALLQSDIDFFMSRQPNHYKITQNQEVSLFKKRRLLEKYYNSIRYYSPTETILLAKDNGLLPTANTNRRVSTEGRLDQTNIQVAGQTTSTQGDLNTHNNTRPVLNNDVTTKSFIEMVYHQQFKGTLNTVKRFFKLTFDEQQNPNKNRILSYDQPLYKTRASKLSKDKQRYHPSLHEELSLEKGHPFIEESNSAPIYAGWDEKARRFVITNRVSGIF